MSYIVVLAIPPPPDDIDPIDPYKVVSLSLSLKGTILFDSVVESLRIIPAQFDEQ